MLMYPFIFQVSLKKSFGFGATISQQVALIFSVVGIISIVLLWPIFLLLYFTGVEVIIWSYVPWELILFAVTSFLRKNEQTWSKVINEMRMRFICNIKMASCRNVKVNGFLCLKQLKMIITYQYIYRIIQCSFISLSIINVELTFSFKKILSFFAFNVFSQFSFRFPSVIYLRNCPRSGHTFLRRYHPAR